MLLWQPALHNRCKLLITHQRVLINLMHFDKLLQLGIWDLVSDDLISEIYRCEYCLQCTLLVGEIVVNLVIN